MNLNEKYKQMDEQISELETKIKEIKKRKKNLNELEFIHQETKQELDHILIKKTEYTKQLEKEEKDVNLLHDSKYLNVLYSFLGGKAEKLKKEEKELLIAREKYNMICLYEESIKNELKRILEQIEQTKQDEIMIQELTKTRKTLLLDSIELQEAIDSPNLEKAIDTTPLERQLTDLQNKVNLLTESIILMEQIKSTLVEIQNYFKIAIKALYETRNSYRFWQYVDRSRTAFNQLTQLKLQLKNKFNVLKTYYHYQSEFALPENPFFNPNDEGNPVIIMTVLKDELTGHYELFNLYIHTVEKDKTRVNLEIEQLSRELERKQDLFKKN